MDINTLNDISLATITSCFNEAFSDYFIPLKFSEEGMASKIKTEGIRLGYSFGAFENGKLAGFILNGFGVVNGVNTVYNGGTGVIPSFRGRGLTAQLYKACIPALKKQGIYRHVLEVIDNNEPAIHVYRNTGFQKRRTLSAYKTAVAIEKAGDWLIRELEEMPSYIDGFSEMVPAWQNSLASINRDRESHRLIGAFDKDTVAGFAAFVPATGRIKYCVVQPQYRRKGIGTALFHYMHQGSKELVVTNVDDGYEPASKFLQALQFKRFLGLYEMELLVEN